MRSLLLIALVFAVAPFTGRGEEKKEKKAAELPVKAKLVAKKTTYTLDLGGKTAAEYREMLKAGEKTGRLPPPPAVDMTLELTNTSNKEIKLWTSGDPVEVILTLTGPGAVNATPMLAFTQEFRVPTATTLAPGKSISIPITQLKYGHRGAAQMSYWTEPGEYQLAASYKTAIQPPPPGTRVNDGFGEATLKAAPITIKVEGK